MTVSAFELRRIAVLASADPRTVRRALLGEPVQPMILDRIVRAMKDAGLEHMLPPNPRRASRRPNTPQSA